MKKHFALLLAFLLVSSLVALAGDAAGAPKILRIFKAETAPGRSATYDAAVRQVRQAVNAGKADFHWIAARPFTGDANQIMFLTFADNFAEVERSEESFNKAAMATFQSADFTRSIAESERSGKNIVAKLREDLSYNLGRFDVANARHWEVSFVEVRPGYGMDFSEMEREAIDLHKRANIDEVWAAYEVEYGGTPGILFLTPLRSLADLDRDLKKEHEAVFTPAIRRRFSAVAREGIAQEKSQIISVRPDLSRPTEAIVAANPDFWTVKEEAPAVAAKGKKTAKVQQAAQKSEARQ
ncbi:MAG TPA: hypothetical protein VNK82_02845 [Terriglobales bacterium]|nr:hypothetical protein [Terriglobales bacterium]